MGNKTKQLTYAFIIGFIIIRVMFWLGGVDIFDRSVEVGVATFISMLGGMFFVTIYIGIKEFLE